MHRTTRTLALCALAWALLFSHPAHAATYYVSPSGSNSNPGTMSSPFQTVARGMSVLRAGDTLYLRAGTYGEINNKTMAIPSGTSYSNAVTIAGYPGETVTIQHRILITTAQYVIIQHVKIAGYSGDNGITVINTDSRGKIADTHVRFMDFEVSGVSGQQGVFTYANYPEFINCRVHGVQAGGSQVGIHGFYLNGHSNIIDGCEVYDNAGYGIQLYNGNDNTGTHDSIIRNNKVYQNGQHCIGGCGGIVLDSGDNIQAHNNQVYNNNANGIDVTLSAVGTKIFNNTLYGNKGGAIHLENGGARGVRNTELSNNTGGTVSDGAVGTRHVGTITPSSGSSPGGAQPGSVGEGPARGSSPTPTGLQIRSLP